jgi:hypothetical protein
MGIPVALDQRRTHNDQPGSLVCSTQRNTARSIVVFVM